MLAQSAATSSIWNIFGVQPDVSNATIGGVDRVLAVDVAILPPRHVVESALKLSASLPTSESRGLILDATSLPHVTLTQQFVRTQDLPSITAAIDAVLQDWPPFPVRVNGPGRGTNSVWMEIQPTHALRELHTALMDALIPFERHETAPGAFSGGDPRPDDLAWVSHFRANSSYDRYRPHITLGHASRVPHIEPVTFDAETIALCQLGRFCTCREVLHAWPLARRRV